MGKGIPSSRQMTEFNYGIQLSCKLEPTLRDRPPGSSCYGRDNKRCNDIFLL